MSYNELFGLGSHSPDANLEGWWPLQDDAASTVIADHSGNARHGTLNGGDNTSGKSTTGPNGWLTSALALNGSDDYISLASGLFSEDGTFGLRLNVNASAGAAAGIMGAFSGSGHYLARNNAGGVRTRTGTNTQLSASMSDGSWHSLLCSHNDLGLGGDEMIVVDGSSLANGNYELADMSALTFQIGRDPRLASQYALMLVAEAFVFSRILTSGEWAEWHAGPEPVNSMAPVLSGTETEGETLSVTTGTWGLDSPFSSGSNGTITYAYQWTRSDDGAGTNEADISGATSSTYTLQAADVGKFLRCRVRASNTGGFDPDADTESGFSGEIQEAGEGDSVSADYPEGLEAGGTFTCTLTKVCLQSDGLSLSDLKDNLATLLSLFNDETNFGDSVDNTSLLQSLLSEGHELGDTFSSEPTLTSSVSEQLELGDQSDNTGTLQSSVSEQIELSDLNDNQADLNSSLNEGSELGETHQGTTGNFVGVTEGLELSDSSSNVGSLLVSVSERILTGDTETGDIGTTTANYSEGLELSDATDNRADLMAGVSEAAGLGETFQDSIEGFVTANWTEGLTLSETIAFITEVIVTPYLPSRTLLDRRLIAFNMRGQRITYHQFDNKQLSHKTGEYIESFNPVTIYKALIGYVDLEMIETSGGKYKKGDRFIKVMSQDLPETPPSLKDQITYDSVKHRIVDFDESGDGNVFLLVCRKI